MAHLFHRERAGTPRRSWLAFLAPNRTGPSDTSFYLRGEGLEASSDPMFGASESVRQLYEEIIDEESAAQ